MISKQSKTILAKQSTPQSNQSKFYHQFDGKSLSENVIPDKGRKIEHSDLENARKMLTHNRSADWIQKVAEEMLGNKQQNIKIRPIKLKKEFVIWLTGMPLECPRCPWLLDQEVCVDAGNNSILILL